MATYQERINRYRILCNEKLPESHRQAYIDAGEDPDNRWSLVWSFSNLADAEKALSDMLNDAMEWQTYKLVDAGETKYITREIW